MSSRALRATVATTLFALAAAAAPVVWAGQGCEAQPLDVHAVERGMALAEATARRLDASGAKVVMLARAGQDLSRYGLSYSHLGFAYRDETVGAWRVLHKLNECGTDRAAIYRQGLGEFFLDRPHRYEAAFVPLAPEVQQRLLPLLRDNQRAVALHTPHYNMVAHPWAQRYQQSNQWAIETLAGAMEPAAASRRQAQAWLQLRDYRPTTLRLNTLTRLGARVTAAHVAFDDHPDEQRYRGRIDTVTVDSVFAWLQRSGLGGAIVSVR